MDKLNRVIRARLDYMKGAAGETEAVEDDIKFDQVELSNYRRKTSNN
jgi:hypothetical protein